MELFKLLGTIAVSNDDANKALDETTTKAKTTKETIDKIRSGAVRLGTAFTGFAGVVGGAFMSSVESTRQYREQMNMLTTAFTSSGHSVEAAKHGCRTMNRPS